MHSLRLAPEHDSEEEMDVDGEESLDDSDTEQHLLLERNNSNAEATNSPVPIDSVRSDSESRNNADDSPSSADDQRATRLHPPGIQSYDPDTIDKRTMIANTAPTNDVLLSWLRERNLNWFLFYEDINQYLRSYTSRYIRLSKEFKLG